MHSPTIGKIAEALAKAQAVFKPALKDSANPFFKSKYVDLAGVLDAIRDGLAANGMAVVQATEISPTGLVLHSQIVHSSGEWLESVYPIKPVKEDPQGYGSALTYARRYSLMSLVGIAAEDDDGNAASGNAAPNHASGKVASVTGETKTKIPAWTPEQQAEVGAIFQEIHTIGGEQGEKDVSNLRKVMKYDAPSHVIDQASILLRKWQDIASQGAQ